MTPDQIELNMAVMTPKGKGVLVVETCRGDLDADPTSTTVDLLEKWNDLGKEG